MATTALSASAHTLPAAFLHGGRQGAPNSLSGTPEQVVEAAPQLSLCRSSPHDERTSRSFLPQARGWRATGKMGSHGAFWWSCTGWGRGAPAWFTWISWLGAAPAAGGVQAQGLGSSRPLRIQGVAPCVLNTDNPPDRRQEVMRGAGWARASNLRDLYGRGWACTPSVQGGEARDRYQGPRCLCKSSERLSF